MIALLCPSRDRQQQFTRMAESAAKTAKLFQIYSGTNGGDGYCRYSFPTDMPTVYMWNYLAAEAMKDKANKLFMLCADDVIFSTPCWDEALLDHHDKLENKIHVYALQDSRDENGTPHPIVTREYIDAMDYFIPPIFLHFFPDTWTVDISRANSCFTHLKDFLLIHDKPSDKGQADETHNHIRRMGWRERDQSVNDNCQHFLEYEKFKLGCAYRGVKLQKLIFS